MGAASTVLAIVAALAVLQSATGITQTVAAKGCTGYQFTLALNSYNFTSFMGDYTVPSSCNRTDIKCATGVSRVRLQDIFDLVPLAASFHSLCHQMSPIA